jgi:hypothetical protein
MDKLAAKAEKLVQKLAESQGGASGSGAYAQQQQGGYAAPQVYQQQGPPPQAQYYQQPGPMQGHFMGEPPQQAPQEQAPPQQQEYLAPTTYSPNPAGPNQGRKKAVLVGVSYAGTRSHLRGTINDVQCLRHCLMTRFNFPESQIVVLRDGAARCEAGHRARGHSRALCVGLFQGPKNTAHTSTQPT